MGPAATGYCYFRFAGPVMIVLTGASFSVEYETSTEWADSLKDRFFTYKHSCQISISRHYLTEIVQHANGTNVFYISFLTEFECNTTNR